MRGEAGVGCVDRDGMEWPPGWGSQSQAQGAKGLAR